MMAKIGKSSFVLYSILLAPLFADILYGVLTYLNVSVAFSPGMMIRGSIVISAFVFVFLNRVNAYFLSFIIIFVLSVLSFLLSLFHVNSWGSAAFNLQLVVRMIYPFALIYILVSLDNTYRWSAHCIVNAIFHAGLFLAVILIISSVLLDTYSYVGGSVYGDKGIFHSTNEISLVLLISLNISICHILQAPKLVNYVGFALIFIALLSIGSRSSLLGGLASPLIFGVMNLKRIKIRFSRRLSVKHLMVFVGLGVILVGGVFKAQDTWRETLESKYHLQKVEQVLTLKLARFEVLSHAVTVMNQRDLTDNFFGTGPDHFFGEVGKRYKRSESGFKSVEMDFIDVFGAFGVFVSIAVLSFYLRPYLKLLIYKIKPDCYLIYSSVFIAVSLTYLHSIFAGHVVFSPLVAGFLCPCFLLINKIQLRKVVMNERLQKKQSN